MKNILSISLIALAGITMSSIALAAGSSYKPQPLSNTHLKYKSLNYGRSYSSRPSSSYSKPSSFPGQGSSYMNDAARSKTAGKLPSFSSFPPSGVNSTSSGGGSSASTSSGIPSSVSTGKPSSFPGQGSSHMNATASGKTAGKLPSFNNFPPSGSSNPRPVGVSTSSIGSGIPSSVSTGRPSSLPPSLPSAASAGRVPSSIPPARTSGGMPSSMPAMPSVTSTRIPGAASAGLANRGKGRP